MRVVGEPRGAMGCGQRQQVAVGMLTLLLWSSLLWGGEVDSQKADVVLEVVPQRTPQPNYGVPVPPMVRGQVRVMGRGGVATVSVTDGFQVVQTDVQGNYSLRPHAQAMFIYLTRPSGYDVVGDWYCPVAARVDFTLRPAEDEQEYLFIHVTDTHLSQQRRSLVGLSRFVREVNALRPRPRFVVNSGDLLDLHKALVNTPEQGHADFRNYVGIMSHLKMPHYNVAGDHTDSSYRLDQFPRGDPRCGKALYWEYLGPQFFSFEYGKVHFFSVDIGYHLGRRQVEVNGKLLHYPTNQVQPLQVEWLRQDLAHRSRGTFAVATAESDLTEHCPGFLELARRHDVRLQLLGDIHVVASKSRPVPYRTAGALAGCWWNPRAQQLCPDLSPQGYLIYRVRGTQLDYFYKGLGQRVAVVSHRVGAAWRGVVTLRAHLVQPQPREVLEYSLDATHWETMERADDKFLRREFAAKVDTHSLNDGQVTLLVRSTATQEVRSRVVVVANGRRRPGDAVVAELQLNIAPASEWTPPRAPAGKVEILLNDQVVGILQPGLRGPVKMSIPASALRSVNVLGFRFMEAQDGLSMGSPTLVYRGENLRDPRDVALRKVKLAHWGAAAADWGGFLVGNVEPPDETPFHRRQNMFCFVIADAKSTTDQGSRGGQERGGAAGNRSGQADSEAAFSARRARPAARKD